MGTRENLRRSRGTAVTAVATTRAVLLAATGALVAAAVAVAVAPCPWPWRRMPRALVVARVAAALAVAGPA